MHTQSTNIRPIRMTKGTRMNQDGFYTAWSHCIFKCLIPRILPYICIKSNHMITTTHTQTITHTHTYDRIDTNCIHMKGNWTRFMRMIYDDEFIFLD